MKTYTLSKSNLSSILASLSVEEKTWAIKFLADNLAQTRKPTRQASTAAVVWNDYKVSPEVMAMTIAHRTEVSGNERNELTELLEEKYR